MRWHGWRGAWGAGQRGGRPRLCEHAQMHLRAQPRSATPGSRRAAARTRTSAPGATRRRRRAPGGRRARERRAVARVGRGGSVCAASAGLRAQTHRRVVNRRACAVAMRPRYDRGRWAHMRHGLCLAACCAVGWWAMASAGAYLPLASHRCSSQLLAAVHRREATIGMRPRRAQVRGRRFQRFVFFLLCAFADWTPKMCVPWPSAVPCVPRRATCEDAHYWRLPSEGVGDATGFEPQQRGAFAACLGFGGALRQRQAAAAEACRTR